MKLSPSRRGLWAGSLGVCALAACSPSIVTPDALPTTADSDWPGAATARPCTELLPAVVCDALLVSASGEPVCTVPTKAPAAALWLATAPPTLLVLSTSGAAIWTRHPSGCLASRPALQPDPLAGGVEKLALDLERGYTWDDGSSGVAGPSEQTSAPQDLLPAAGLEIVQLTVDAFEVRSATTGDLLAGWSLPEEDSCNARHVRVLEAGGQVLLHTVAESGSACVGADSEATETVERVVAWSPSSPTGDLLLEQVSSRFDGSKVAWSSTSRASRRQQTWTVGPARLTHTHETVFQRSIEATAPTPGGDYDLDTSPTCHSVEQDSDAGTWTVDLDGQTLSLATFPATAPREEDGGCAR